MPERLKAARMVDDEPPPQAGQLPKLTGIPGAIDTGISSIADFVRGLIGMGAGEGKSNSNALGNLLPFAIGGIGGLPEGLNPQAIEELLKREGIATAEPMVNALGKPVSEMLGTALQTPAKSGLPQRLTITNWRAPAEEIEMMAGTKAAGNTRFRIKPDELDSLINKGMIDVAQPPAEAVGAVQSKLRRALDVSDRRAGELVQSSRDVKRYKDRYLYSDADQARYDEAVRKARK